MITITESILSGTLLVFISGLVGNVLGKKNNINEKTCKDHRVNCSNLLGTKIDNLSKRIDELKKAVDGKLLGL